LRVVAELIEAGAQINTIYRNLFERNTLGRLRLIGETLVDLHIGFEGKVAYALISLENMARAGAIPPDTEDLIDYVISVNGVSVGLLFIEQARGGVKVSFRSRNDLDCSRLAGSLGGGGHRAAAGVTLAVSMSESVPLVLEAVRKALEGHA
jgi:bifunctional oligoribonuclease and PAP phosphatase NrnA